jgi:hypothetical protein
MNRKIQSLLFCAFIEFLSPLPGPQAQQSAPAWRHALGGAVIGAPAAQAESVVAICDGGTVEAYSRQGTPLWSFKARAA